MSKSLAVSLVCFTVFTLLLRSVESVCCVQSGSNDAGTAVYIPCPGGLYPAARSPAMVCDSNAGGGTSNCTVVGNTGFTINPMTTYEFLCCTSVTAIAGVQVAPEACPPCFATRDAVVAALDGITAAEVTYGPLKFWCFEAMSYDNLFNGKANFNLDISGWDVSKVTNMENMFNLAGAFNQPIGNWNVGQVTTMLGMFNRALAFNQPIGNWNVGQVSNMNGMFFLAGAFNQPIGSWNVGQVTLMLGMFNGAGAFNQDLCAWGPRMQAAPMTTAVAGMFSDSGCPNKDNPNVVMTPGTVQPLCVANCPP